ncbi:Uma2 family endonuclease [Thiospirillum jenense]|uniref:Uma2 family endonuclease n=1 Tax=Thiospirillum jenense TaxID=1653858 RepID=A0A839HBV0_9GAMM|nr:Uma2 family endonuclease [Thiospirillum jenense]MBB1126443.1 Uma2 family endonuclease [Thiospirillum jenense]
MSTLAQQPFLSIDDYLTSEDGAECCHEYINGALYAMTGATDRHCLIVGNLCAVLRPQLRGTTCQLFANTMKVRLRIAEQDIFYYPDLLLSCDPTDRATYYCTAPCLLVEVLSESTARIDRREKLFSYMTIPSLQEYVIIDQWERQIEIYRRSTDWAIERLTAGQLELTCLPISVPFDVIYEDVEMGRRD